MQYYLSELTQISLVNLKMFLLTKDRNDFLVQDHKLHAVVTPI